MNKREIQEDKKSSMKSKKEQNRKMDTKRVHPNFQKTKINFPNQLPEQDIELK